MINKKTIYKIMFSVILLSMYLISTQCSFEPPTAPKWETTLTIPLINKTFEMKEIVSDEKYLNSDSSDNINFEFEKKIDRNSIGNNLQIDAFNQEFISTFGIFEINSPEVQEMNFQLKDIYSQSEIFHGQTLEIPSFDLIPVATQVEETDDFTWAVLESGTILLTVQNNMSIYLGSPIYLKIFDKEFNSLVDEVIINELIAPGESFQSNISLNKKRISNNLEVAISGKSIGSNGETIRVDAHSSFSIYAEFKDLKVKEALAKIPEHKVGKEENVQIQDSILISDAKIFSGNLYLDIQNQLAINSKIILEFCDFYSNDDNYIIDSVIVPAKSYFPYNLPLENLNVRPAPSPMGEQQLKVKWTFKTIPTDQHIHVRDTDYMNVKVTSEPIVFSEIDGILHEFSVDIKPYIEHLKFADKLDSVYLDNAMMYLEIENAINLPAKSDLVVRGKNESGNEVDLPIDETINAAPVRGKSITSITLTKSNSNIVDFLNLLPKQIEIFGSLKFGDGNSQGLITQNDYIEGNVKIIAPLALSFPNQTATSKVEKVKLEEDARKKIKNNIISGEVCAVISNHLPIGASIQANFSRNDSTVYSNPELIIGPFTIDPALTNEYGITQDSVSNEIKFELSKDDLAIFEDTPFFTGLEIFMPGTEDNSVKIMKSDYLSIQMYSVLKLAIDFDND